MDEVAGQPAAHEVADIRADEGDPEADERLLELEAAAYQEQGEPVGDEEPVGVEDGPGEDDAPRLPVSHERPQRDLRRRRRLARAGSCREDQGSLRIADVRVVFRTA